MLQDLPLSLHRTVPQGMASLAAKLLCVGVCCAVRWLVCAAAMQALRLHLDGMLCSTVLFHTVLLGCRLPAAAG